MTSEIKSHEFWVVNLSDKNVSLRDLAITIPAHSNKNLLGKKSQYTLEQLLASVESGSIFAKRDKIKVRNVPPQIPVPPGIYIMKEIRTGPIRSLVEIKEPKYVELDFSDEQFVANMSDIDLELDAEDKTK